VLLRQKGRFSISKPFMYDSNPTIQLVADLVKSAEAFGLRRHIGAL